MPSSAEISADRTRDLSLLMTEWPSVTGSLDEAAFSQRLVDLLATTPYFASHPQQLITVDSHGEPMTKNVLALVRGKGRKCIVLAGHFDTVSIANYGTLAPLACQPGALLKALVQELSSRPLNAVEQRTLDDLNSGDFLPGRGLLDMKSGLAAGVAVLERFAALDERIGNILLVATPDEENRSRGMRSVRNALPRIAKEWDLDIIGGINLDASGCDKDGEEGRAVYLGSVGKFAPFAFVIGRPTHAGYPFNGTSAHLIASEIILKMDTNPALSDEAHGEHSPPPVCLEAKDLRSGYEVTTPSRVWLSFNWLTHRRSAATLLDDFRTIVTDALNTALARQSRNAEDAAARGQMAGASAMDGAVLTYADLHDLAFARSGQSALDRIRALDESLKTADDPLAVTRELVNALMTEAKLEGPAVVIGFSSLHYPLVHLDQAGDAGAAFQRTMETVMHRISERHQTGIKFKQIFAGISDMSFFGHSPDAQDAGLLSANTPSAAFADKPPEGLLSYPVVNIGPWGRDYHQKWERVHTPYTFGVLPDFVFEAAVACLED
ncbi:M20/M25/M40 family metallo-hydrolase [Pararhizobium sp.]|uniref:M20/M25/M40 family metallo-hydrolase n=1 Tax=Pararhizobium sp. TaxID=1977563 RepID=UPI00271973D3|nr:M20/M25/M40 family metallo-hydrolase [Pararhizobium sp.]MDO9418750.1 M20/M25/M40 family metallo-hydrolase [Pararhizobium sp.]